jgi:hypothetical protein
MTIKVEVLSVDSIPALLAEVGDRIRNEFITGQLVADDGDSVAWDMQSKHVGF